MIGSIQVEITYVSWKLSWLSLVIILRILLHAANEKFSLSMTSDSREVFISLKVSLALSKLDVWKLYWLPKYNSVCLYFLALNLILHSKGILQQNFLSRNLKFYFFCIQLFQTVWFSTIGENDCVTYLRGPSPSPSMCAASEPQELLGSPFTGSQVYHPGLLVRQTEPDAVMAVRAHPGSVWLASFCSCSIHLPTRIHLDHLCAASLGSMHTFLHPCLHIISAGFHEAQMLGQRQQARKCRVKCRSFPTSRVKQAKGFA